MTPSAPGGCHCGRWLSSFLQVCFAGRLSATELIPMHMRSGQVREVVGLSFEAVFGSHYLVHQGTGRYMS